MKNETNIAWATYTTNVVHGCHKPAALPEAGMKILRATTAEWDFPANLENWQKDGTSPECVRCYAETLSLRRQWTKLPWAAANAATNVQLHPERMAEWAKIPVVDPHWPPSERVRFFVCSMGDIFHERVPDTFLVQCFREFRRSRHIYMLLTKRIDRAAAKRQPWATAKEGGWPENVWLGTTVGHPITKWRLHYLQQSPARTRFVSMEPLVQSLTDSHAESLFGKLDLYGIDQIIVGGESGAGFRPMKMQWARELRDVARRDGCAFFFKQDASFRAGERPWIVEHDGRRMEYQQFPGEFTAPRLVSTAEAITIKGTESHEEQFHVLG